MLTATSRWREGVEHRFAPGSPVRVFCARPRAQWVKLEARVADLLRTLVSSPRISPMIGPAGCRINRDYERRGWAAKTSYPS